MSSIEQGYAIYIPNWWDKPPVSIGQDLASVGLEAGKTSWEKRINPVVVNIDEFGKQLVKEGGQNPEDIATFKIYQWANEDSPAIKIWTGFSSPTKREIFDALSPFADFNPGKLLIWISPPLEGVYEEARIVIYETIELNNQKYLFLRGLCGNQTTKECLKIASQLLPFTDSPKILGEIADSEQLRATPIPLLLPPKETYTSFFSQFINLPEVWEAIAQGEDLKEKKWALEVTEGIVKKNYHQIIQAKTFAEQLRVGLIVEQELAKGLGRALQSGPCGKLYSDLSVRSLISEVLGFNIFINRERAHCGKCGKYGPFSPGEKCVLK